MKPKALRPGDTIALVSPGSPLAPEKVEFGIRLLEDAGYKTKLMPHAFDAQGYLAGSDKNRAADLMEAFLDPDVDAIYCTRGGYGCARLFPYLDLDKMAASRKMFLGFSDITTLHLALNRRGLPTVYAPMPLILTHPREEWVYESLRRVLRGDDPIPAEATRGTTINRGTAEGVVTGGCVIRVCDGIGTLDAIEPEGKLLLFEEVHEKPQRVDAMFTHLRNAGVLQAAAGIVIGEMTGTDELMDPTIGATPWREIIADRVADLGKPTIIDFPFGHAKQMLSLPQGIRARLDADAGTLTYLESLCT